MHSSVDFLQEYLPVRSFGESSNEEYADKIYCTGNEGVYDGKRTYWISSVRAGCKVNNGGEEMPYGLQISKAEFETPACDGWGCNMDVNNPEPDRSNQMCVAFNTTTNQCEQYQDMPSWPQSQPEEDEGWPDPRPDVDYDDGDDYGAPIKIYDDPMIEDDCGWRGRNPDGGGCFETYYDPLVGRKGHEGIDYAASDVTTIYLANQSVYADPRKGTYYDALDAATRDSDGYLLTTQPVLYDAPMVKDPELPFNFDTRRGDATTTPIQPQTDKNGVAIIDPCAGTRCIALYKPCPEGYIDGNKCCPNTGNCIPDPNYVGTIKPALPIGQTPSTQLVTPVAIATPAVLSPVKNASTPTTAAPVTAPAAEVKKDSPLAIAALLFLAFEVLG